jgi:uncharacterized membrane protein YraQ (UPF0718 family)
MSNCCKTHESGSGQKSRPDYLLWVSLTLVIVAYGLYLLEAFSSDSKLGLATESVFMLMNIVWWGLLLGILLLAALSKIPREFIISLLGTGLGFRGIMRAVVGGVLLDLCSHGILMVGAKLYERGASLGQVMAFLIASPWNSFTLTIILIALIGFYWTLFFIVASMVIALISGVIFDVLVRRGVLPKNPHTTDLPEGFQFLPQAKQSIANTRFDKTLIISMLRSGVVESRMVVRWILFGVLLATAIRMFLDVDTFQQYFGPTLLGLSATLFFATIIEVCSEGSAPLAGDLLTRANAPGNSFAFLMAGVSTDYTEIMVLKDATRSWKIAFFLPLITLPQILVIAYMVNSFTS